MKTKIILTALCLCLGFSAMAQRHNRNRGGENQPQHRPQMQAPRSFDMVVDTAIINTMALDSEIVAKVSELQAQKAQEFRTMIIEMASKNQQGQQASAESIAAMQEQIENYKFEYRMALRKILGVENYINYLEKQVDKRPAMNPGMGAGMPRRGNWGNGQMPQVQGNWGGGQMPQGGFDGNEGGFGGSGFGGGFGGGGFGEE